MLGYLPLAISATLRFRCAPVVASSKLANARSAFTILHSSSSNSKLTILNSQLSPSPTGICLIARGLARSAYPGNRVINLSTPTGLCPRVTERICNKESRHYCLVIQDKVLGYLPLAISAVLRFRCATVPLRYGCRVFHAIPILKTSTHPQRDNSPRIIAFQFLSIPPPVQKL